MYRTRHLPAATGSTCGRYCGYLPSLFHLVSLPESQVTFLLLLFSYLLHVKYHSQVTFFHSFIFIVKYWQLIWRILLCYYYMFHIYCNIIPKSPFFSFFHICCKTSTTNWKNLTLLLLFFFILIVKCNPSHFLAFFHICCRISTSNWKNLTFLNLSKCRKSI
jgi:hypothetical protein